MASVNKALTKLLQLRGQITFFKDLAPDEIADLLFNIRFRKFEKDELLFKQGDTKTKEIYYLLAGSIDLSLDGIDGGDDIFLVSLDKPTLFGEMRSFIGEPRTATAKAGAKGAILISFLIRESKEHTSPIAFAKFYKNVIEALANKIMTMNDNHK